MRNQMHSFASTPSANIPRSRFNMPCNVKFTGNTGRLIPFYVCEVLPGDTFEVSTSVVCRMQTLIHPLMDNIYLDSYYFFVPNRLVWDNWKHFCGEPNKAWVPDREWTVPRIAFGISDPSEYEGSTPTEQKNDFLKVSFKDSILDYMGIGVNSFASGSINALPVRAYNKIYDDWFRDENLIDPVNLYTGDSMVVMNTKALWEDPLLGGKPYKAAKLHDYFTSALPQAQRGNPVELAFGNSINAPVTTSTNYHSVSTPLTFQSQYGSIASGTLRVDTDSRQLYSSTDSSLIELMPNNLYANLSGLNIGISINDLRMAFQVQKFMERSARGGARYIELLKSMFGVTSPDARLQRSEYLGGHRVPINIHQIANTTETAETPLGNLGALSVTSDVHNDFIHSFTEHGFVIGICVVRYKHSYPQGMDRMWNRKTKFDYYWPVFANIGEQPIKNFEIYYGVSNDYVFGYQEAWADYRYKPNRVMGEMRPNVPNSLASWHLADNYSTVPVLSKDWIEEDSMPVDRAIAVQSSVADQFLFDIMINNNATRPMPLYSVPGLVDHF